MSATLGSGAIEVAVVDIAERVRAITLYVPASERARTTADPCAPVPPITRTDCIFLPQDIMEYQSTNSRNKDAVVREENLVDWFSSFANIVLSSNLPPVQYYHFI